jgi:hypothetical protein
MPGSSRGERRIPPEYCEVGASGIGSARHAIMSPVVRNSVVNVTVNVLFVPMFPRPHVPPMIVSRPHRRDIGTLARL